MRAIAGLFIAVVMGLLPAGCGMTSAKGDAELVAQSYFDSVQYHDYDAAMDLFSAKFYEETPRDEWRKMVEKIDEKLGPVQSYKLVGWRVFKGTRAGLSGTIVDLSYEVKHQKHSAQVAMVVNKSPGGDTYEIVGMNVNSPGLLLE